MRRAAFLALVLMAVSVPADAQELSPAGWCTQHHPCDWFSHAGGVVAGSVVLQAVTPLRAELARWIPAAYYVQREIRGLIRFGPGLPDTNQAFELPMWLDTTLDLSFVAIGVWLAPKAGRSLWGNDLTLSFGPLAIP